MVGWIVLIGCGFIITYGEIHLWVLESTYSGLRGKVNNYCPSLIVVMVKPFLRCCSLPCDGTPPMQLGKEFQGLVVRWCVTWRGICRWRFSYMLAALALVGIRVSRFAVRWAQMIITMHFADGAYCSHCALEVEGKTVYMRCKWSGLLYPGRHQAF